MNVADLVAQGAIFAVSHSGGKDSQAMYNLILTQVPKDQIVVVHASLGRIEWDGVIEHIISTTIHSLEIAKAIWRDGTEKDLLGMVKHRFKSNPDVPSWPSPSNRQCTSDLKRGPIQKVLRRIARERNADTIINCVGYRRQESSTRAKHVEWSVCNDLTIAGRQAFNWYPILDWTKDEVFAYIEACGQKPHWAYEKNERLSCVFCIMGSVNDLKHGAEQRPELFEEYMEAERATGWTMFHKKSLADMIATDRPARLQENQMRMCF